MGMSSGGSKGGAIAEINVTPMVDVMLVLLIIFMVTAPMMNDAGVEIDLPPSDAPPLMEDDDAEQLILTIDKTNRVWIGENLQEPTELPARLAAIAKANPDAHVFLRADGDVPYREVASLLGIARRAGMPKVGLVFEPGGEPVADGSR